MDYVDCFKQAARLFWNTKVLWLLGIIAALFGQNEYSFSVNYSQSTPITTPGQMDSPLAAISANPFVSAFIAHPLLYFLAVGGVVIVWWIIATYVGWLVQGAMIHMVAQANQDIPVSIRTSLSQSRQQVWSLFLMRLLFSIPSIVALVLALLLVVPLLISVFSTTTPDIMAIFPRLLATMACLVPLFFVAGLVGIVLNILNIFAARGCVLEQLPIRASLRQAWLMLRRNLGYTVLNWFVLFICGAIFSFMAAIPALLLIIPLGQAFFNNQWSPVAQGALVGLGIYFVVISLGIGGILTSFNSTLWTVLYRAFQRSNNAGPETPPSYSGFPV